MDEQIEKKIQHLVNEAVGRATDPPAFMFG
jgi:hypothetical protein